MDVTPNLKIHFLTATINRTLIVERGATSTSSLLNILFNTNDSKAIDLDAYLEIKNTKEFQSIIVQYCLKYNFKIDDSVLSVFLRKIPLDSTFNIKFGEFSTEEYLKIKQIYPNLNELASHYNFYAVGNSELILNSSIKRSDLVCRFCGTKNNELNPKGNSATFQKRSHAISEGLGNKNVLIADECDECNKHFASTIEPHIIRFLSFFRTLYRIEGKGCPKIHDTENLTMDENELFVKNTSESINEENIFSTTFAVNGTTINKEMYIPQNVYRSLTKFAISIMPLEELDNFKTTIDWLNGKKINENLPLISITTNQEIFNRQPQLFIFLRKNTSNLPYSFAKLFFGHLSLSYVLPYCILDELTYSLAKESIDLWHELDKPFPFNEKTLQNFSSELLTSMNYEMTFIKGFK